MGVRVWLLLPSACFAANSDRADCMVACTDGSNLTGCPSHADIAQSAFGDPRDESCRVTVASGCRAELSAMGSNLTCFAGASCQQEFEAATKCFNETAACKRLPEVQTFMGIASTMPLDCAASCSAYCSKLGHGTSRVSDCGITTVGNCALSCSSGTCESARTVFSDYGSSCHLGTSKICCCGSQGGLLSRTTAVTPAIVVWIFAMIWFLR